MNLTPYLPNESMEPNSRCDSALSEQLRFGCSCDALTFVPAAVAHFGRWA